MALLVFVTALLAVVCAGLWRQRRTLRREVFIRNHPLPQGLFDNLRKKRPELQLKDCQLVAHALRHFFLAYLKSGRQYVSMPSQVADDLWHEFILFTRHYEVFCRQAFGGFLHHTPAVAVGGGARADAGLRRVWWHACKEDHINPRAPTRLPLLFALDAKLGVAGGFVYALDCRTQAPRRDGESGSNTTVQCGGDLAAGDGGSSSGDGGWGGGSNDSGGGDGGSDGGCGGGGCGGGD